MRATPIAKSKQRRPAASFKRASTHQSLSKCREGLDGLRSAQTAYDAKKTKAPGRVGRAINNAMDVAISPLQIRWLSQPNLRQCRRMHRFGGDELQHTSQYLPTAMVQEFRVVDQSQKMQKAHALSRCKSNQNRNPSGSSPNSPHTTRLSRFQILQELASLC